MRSTVPIRQGRMRPSVQRRRVQGRRKVTLGGKLLLLLLIALLFILLPPLLFNARGRHWPQPDRGLRGPGAGRCAQSHAESV